MLPFASVVSPFKLQKDTTHNKTIVRVTNVF